MGMTFERCNVWKNDESLWTDVIKKYPDDNRITLAFINRADYYDIKERHDDALKDYLTVLNSNPRDAYALWKAGKICGKNKHDLPSAISYLLRAKEVNPRDLEVLKDLGTAYGMIGDFKSSLEYTIKGLELKPDDAILLYNLGICYMNSGDRKRGEENITRAIKLDPSLQRK
jgi:tetratricopeptide (TPR) repeat protein